jgi:hypothetical protein
MNKNNVLEFVSRDAISDPPNSFAEIGCAAVNQSSCGSRALGTAEPVF